MCRVLCIPSQNLLEHKAIYSTRASCVLIMYIHTADNMCIFAEKMMTSCLIEGSKFLYEASIQHVTVTGVFHRGYY